MPWLKAQTYSLARFYCALLFEVFQVFTELFTLFLASTGTKLLTLFEFLQKQKLELGDNKPNMKHSLKYLLFTEVLSFFPFLFLRIQLQLGANSSDTKQFLLRARRIRRRAKLFLAFQGYRTFIYAQTHFSPC